MDEDFGESQNGDDWYVSYSDIVTLLLCFFIIFYSVEKSIGQKVKEENKTLGNSKEQYSLSLTDAQGMFLEDGSVCKDRFD